MRQAIIGAGHRPLMAKSTPAFGLFSIAFGGTNEPPLPMRDLPSNLVLGAAPEWVIKRRSAPVAYPRGATPHLSVVFQAANIDVFPEGKRFTIEASGGGIAVVPQRMPLAMSPGKPLSDPIVFPFTAPIKGSIGIRTFTLQWTATDPSGDTFSIGSSTHSMYVTWEPAPKAAVPPFEIVVQTACDAAAGESTVKGIAEELVDAIAGLNLARSESGSNVRTALLQKAADSGGFSAILVQMLSSQGIVGETRAIYVDWQRPPTTELQWVPTASIALPSASGPEVHCVTLIAVAKGVLLCDADSGIGPIAMAMTLPKDEAWTLKGPAFREAAEGIPYTGRQTPPALLEADARAIGRAG